MTTTLVCFDLGNVLVRICATWAEACEAAGLPLREGVRDVAPTPERMDLIARHETGDISCADFFREIALTMNDLYTPAEVEQVHAAWLCEEFEGAPDLVTRLRASDAVELACLSNTNHSHWRRLTEYPSIAALHHRHASHLLRLRKPNADIYAQFEHLVGRGPGEILFFDDLAENVETARRRGWRAEIIEPAASPVGQIEDYLRRLRLV